ncbi:hypothetical protein LPJ59_001675 [Coemansia sp. RSA 2399]|nr:hypothetical protein LPJ59_001675 [Coemansia sp. RSA 2399]KAJ1904656.1 hypothetical protein LPJ81_002368 [Coemansia sp. IMI 209127]
MLSNHTEGVFNHSVYLPSKGAAFGVAAVYYAFGVVLTVQSVRARNFSPSWYAVLTALMLGGAFTARGVYAPQNSVNSSAITAFSVLDAIAPNFVNLVDYIVLIVLLRGLSRPPPRHILLGMRVFAIFIALTFGALATAGMVLAARNSSNKYPNTAIELIRASVAGQLSANILFVILASVLLLRYREALRFTRTVIIIYTGGLLLIAHNSAKIVPAFYPQNTLMRSSEAALYCLDPLFTLLIIFVWVVLDLPRRCRQKTVDASKAYNNTA